MLLRHVPGDGAKNGGERSERNVGSPAAPRRARTATETANASCRRQVHARRRAHWLRCARSCRSRRCRRIEPKQYWRQPCATSSAFERWRRPVMLSATTADSRLSMLPSSVNESSCRKHVQHLCRATALASVALAANWEFRQIGCRSSRCEAGTPRRRQLAERRRRSGRPASADASAAPRQLTPIDKCRDRPRPPH